MCLIIASIAQDTITLTRSVKEGETLVSAHGNFKLGFFSPDSQGKYVGIWFNNIPDKTYVRFASRERPLIGSSGVLQITYNSILQLVNGTGGIMWSMNASRSIQNPIAQLLDSGNLVIRDQNDASSDNDLWQSFDYPSDSLLSRMKLGRDLITGFDRFPTFWRSSNDPSPGSYTYRINPRGYPQLVLYKNSVKISRDGPWNGFWFSGYSIIDPDLTSEYRFVFNSTETYYVCNLINTSVIAMDRILSTDKGFVKYSNVKLPDTRNAWYNTTMNLDECQRQCLRNCSCVAYANLYASLKADGESGCLLWFDTLTDVKEIGINQGKQIQYTPLSAGNGEKDFNEMPNFILIGDKGSEAGKRRIWISVCSSFLCLLLLSGIIMFVLWRRKAAKRKAKVRGGAGESGVNNSKNQASELPIFAFNVVAPATNFFSPANKLGEGGFRPVYKFSNCVHHNSLGVLDDGQQIAVKRLCKDSKQGLEEFKNEAIFIAKLQHRNLVKLCFEIIKGIARGLLCLHQDSQLRIVHRDLKASNILLDSEMKVKISDFGMARSFDGCEDEAKTKRVVGTYGYMPPEYAIDGLFSVKFDVFSFGVLMLEIVSGKRNRGFNHPDHHHNLLGHAWMLFREGTSSDIVDPLIRNSSYEQQMQRSIHISLPCVQQHTEDRPTMPLVNVMLSSNCELPEPKQPGFYIARYVQQESISGKNGSSSNDEMTTTLLFGR
ncbi:hypothetical protein Cgig2_000932 [Carnegiea gigantea]|uniref:Receptor-like serine/threonine-protein kinase n=1 Tax=Carnegiea gigantea TaxID=171969 RepID=A0A9Q1KM37_9CARY|nr:hypothetical protein Cgig2_000932 [Carnegiea gigantea]